MIGLRQFVQSKHSEDSSERSAQHCCLKRNRHKRRPAMKGAASDVQRIIYDLHVVHHEVARESAEDSTQKNNQGQPRLVKPYRLGQLLNRKRRVAVNPTVALVIGLTRGLHQIGRIIELGHKAVEWRFRLHDFSFEFSVLSFQKTASGLKTENSKLKTVKLLPPLLPPAAEWSASRRWRCWAGSV